MISNVKKWRFEIKRIGSKCCHHLFIPSAFISIKKFAVEDRIFLHSVFFSFQLRKDVQEEHKASSWFRHIDPEYYIRLQRIAEGEVILKLRCKRIFFAFYSVSETLLLSEQTLFITVLCKNISKSI